MLTNSSTHLRKGLASLLEASPNKQTVTDALADCWKQILDLLIQQPTIDGRKYVELYLKLIHLRLNSGQRPEVCWFNIDFNERMSDFDLNNRQFNYGEDWILRTMEQS
jgi:hypothetical protein